MSDASELWPSAHYRRIVELIDQLKPLVPDYDPVAANVEEWKVRSAQKQLHELVMKILKPKE